MDATTDHPRILRPPARRARHLVAAALVVAAATGLAACGGATARTSPPSAAATPPGAGGAPGATPTASAQVTIESFAFSPSKLTVAPGATITVTNRDSVAHTLTARDGAFDTGQIQPGRTATVRAPTKAGSYAYYCTIHQFMTGTITVSGG